MRVLLHLTELVQLSLQHGGITGETLAQIQPGSWPNLQDLACFNNDFSGDPVGAMEGLLCPKTISGLSLGERGLSAEAIGQIKPGDWLHLQILMIGYNHLNDAPMGAMKGLPCLSSLDNLYIENCGWSQKENREIYAARGIKPIYYLIPL